MNTIRIKYRNEEQPRLKAIAKGDWIDLYTSEEVTLKAGEHKLIDLGVAMELPEGYEAWVAPRSSTMKHFGVIFANSFGIIDNSYNGNDDYWKASVIAQRDTTIGKHERIAQFRIMESQFKNGLELKEVDELSGEGRGGFGTTGTKKLDDLVEIKIIGKTDSLEQARKMVGLHVGLTSDKYTITTSLSSFEHVFELKVSFIENKKDIFYNWDSINGELIVWIPVDDKKK